jgi:hypothetical protein
MSHKHLSKRLKQLEDQAQKRLVGFAPPWVVAQGPEAASEWVRKHGKWQAVCLPELIPYDDTPSE